MTEKFSHTFVGSKRVMIWRDERPACTTFASSSAEREFHAGPAFYTRNIYVAIELNFPAGPMVQYALLGGSFFPDKSDRLKVIFSCVGDSRQPFTSEIATDKEAIFFGIPEEYIESIIDEIGNSEFIQAGRLDINCGSHSLYGSSTRSFRLATRMFLRLLGREGSANSKDFLEQLVT